MKLPESRLVPLSNLSCPRTLSLDAVGLVFPFLPLQVTELKSLANTFCALTYGMAVNPLLYDDDLGYCPIVKI